MNSWKVCLEIQKDAEHKYVTRLLMWEISKWGEKKLQKIFN